jgi:hypothetical protein
MEGELRENAHQCRRTWQMMFRRIPSKQRAIAARTAAGTLKRNALQDMVGGRIHCDTDNCWGGSSGGGERSLDANTPNGEKQLLDSGGKQSGVMHSVGPHGYAPLGAKREELPK